MNKFFKELKIALLACFTLGICACGDSGSGSKTAGGTSEESEGIAVISDKTIAGVSQKGPFLTGSDVYLKETSADSSLTPTGREFFASILNDKGEFKMEYISLVSPYALFTASGYYKREDGRNSNCIVSLNAVSSLDNRDEVNINILTHFEYGRVMNLVQSGVAFDEAKRQAFNDLVNAFGFSEVPNLAEDLDITKSSYADSMLLALSYLVDHYDVYTQDYEQNQKYCSGLQKYMDGVVVDFADDGIISDSLLDELVIHALYYFTYAHSMTVRLGVINDSESVSSEGTVDIDNYEDYRKVEPFMESFFENYFKTGKCTEDRMGETVNMSPIYGHLDSLTSSNAKRWAVLACNDGKWAPYTQTEYETYLKKFPHEVGSMTDERTGKTYPTTKFTYNDREYEWMAENLQYNWDGKQLDTDSGTVYSWVGAMGLPDSLKNEPIDASMIDSVHQGVCPEGWHIPDGLEWTALILYVDTNANYLLEPRFMTKYNDDGDFDYVGPKYLHSSLFNNLDFSALSTTEADYRNWEDVPAYGVVNFAVSTKTDSLLTLTTTGIESFDNAAASFSGQEALQLSSNFLGIRIAMDNFDTYRGGRPEKSYVRCVKN